jgi:hypothetical protein
VDEVAALGRDEAEKVIAARDQIITSLRRASIKQTRPSDWVLNKDRDGRVRAFLEDAGCQRLMPLWGIVVRNVTIPKRDNSEDGKEFAYTVIGDGYCTLTRQTVEAMEGTRYSTERYAQEKAEGIQREVAVKKAARANLEGRIVRNLAGLNNVPLDDLIQITGDRDFEKKATHGHGYGSSSERRGAEADDHGIAPADIPTCDACAGLPKPVASRMVFKKEMGKAKKPGWYCPNWKAHEKTTFIIDHADLVAMLEKEKAAKAQRQPGDEQE